MGILGFLKKRKGFNLVFEDVTNLRNLVSCDIDLYGRKMHETGSLISSLLRLDDTLVFELRSRPSSYIYPIGLYHHPWQWAGHPYNRERPTSIFDDIPMVVMDDLRSGRALLLFDQVQEASQARWLYDWFHHNLSEHGIPPDSLVYCTGDISASDSYDAYCRDNDVTDKINLLSDLVIQCYDICHYTGYHAITWEEQMRHKSQMVTDVKLYNCLNRRITAPRQWLYLRLAEEGLISDGIVSMDRFEKTEPLYNHIEYPIDKAEKHIENLPMHVDITDFADNPFMNVNMDVYLNSWFSIVTETTATINDDSVMITEKSMKPMIAGHPFMVWGNRKTLRYLRELGFKTFPELWDESYDTVYDFYRLDRIIRNVIEAKKIEDKMEWFKRCEDSVCHNQEMALKMSWDSSRQYGMLNKIWCELISNKERYLI